LNNDHTPRGFAYRDLEGISTEKEPVYLETFSWFYRYHIFIKLLNVITNIGENDLAPPFGAPYQIGYSKKLRERNLHHYLLNKMAGEEKIQPKALAVLSQLSLTLKQYHQLLEDLDQAYLSRLSCYFDTEKADILMKDGHLPAAESGSSGENLLLKLNIQLWKHRYSVAPRLATISQQGKRDFNRIFSEKNPLNAPFLTPEFLKICTRFMENGNYDPLPSLLALSHSLASNQTRSQSKKTAFGKVSSSMKDIQKWHKNLVYKELREQEEKARKAALGSIHTLHNLKHRYPYEHEPFEKIPDEFLSDLLFAAKYGLCDTLSSLLNQTADRNQRSVQDALCVAAMSGQLEAVKLLFKMGVDLRFKRSFDIFRDVYMERLTPLGHAIHYRRREIIDFLVTHECEIDAVSHYEKDEGAIDFFFQYHSTKGPDPELLALILAKHPKIKPFNSETIFNIAVYTNSKELNLLLEAGLDPNSLQREEENPSYKGKDYVKYRAEANLLDFTVIQAERANLFQDNEDAIEKVRLLIQKGADPKKSKNFCNQSYLHKVTHPKLVKLFCQAGVDITAQALAYDFAKYHICPINLAYQLDVIDLLCAHGERRDHAPYLKGTQAHREALERIGFKGEAFDPKEDVPILIKAIKLMDIPAVIALIGEGIDVNQRTREGMRWTALHWLFSKIHHNSISEEYDYIDLAEDIHLRLINLLIKSGAKPLKDDAGRTPLMCLTFHPFGSRCNDRIIKDYISFEADYYGFDLEEYRQKFYKLRGGGYQSVDHISTPIVAQFNAFWKSFEKHHSFLPSKSHHPNSDWLKMRAIFND
jgi:hypothetical protein